MKTKILLASAFALLAQGCATAPGLYSYRQATAILAPTIRSGKTLLVSLPITTSKLKTSPRTAVSFTPSRRALVTIWLIAESAGSRRA